MKEMYDNPKHAEDTFNENNLSEYLLQAQWAEFVQLKKAITEVYKRKKRPLNVLDIGIGNARIPKHLSGIDETWRLIGRYDSIDVAQSCVDLSNKIVTGLGINDKVSAKQLDAVNLNTLNKRYDLIISTWFTVGNFYPFGFDIKRFYHGYDLSRNDKFEMIFRQVYSMLSSYGEIIIGSVYIDNEATRKKQEDSYKHFGWIVITDQRDSFTATKEGWWSQRYTKKQLCNYLDFVPRNKIFFTPLDTYDYAMMVRIRK